MAPTDPRPNASLDPFASAYATTLANMDQGFCLLEKVNTPDEQTPDFRYQMVNPAFEKHTGLTNLLGKTIRQVVPQAEKSTMAIYEQVALTGQPAQFQAYVAQLDSWLEANVFQVSQQPAQIAVLFTSITERKRALDVLRQNEERQAFLLKLSDDFRAHSNPQAIGALATRMLAQHMQLDRCYIAQFSRQEERGWIGPEHRSAALPPLSGEYRFADFPEGMKRLETGPLIIRDLLNDPSLSETDKRSMDQALGIHGMLSAVLRKGERNYFWCLTAATRGPRDWTDAELKLLEEVAERTWAAMERARTEDALRQADQRKDEFLAMLGHELRNPLAAISNTLLVLELTQGQDESLPYAKGIRQLNRHSQHLNRMVDDLLDMSRIRQGIVRLKKEVVKLAQLLQLTVEAAQPLFRDGQRHLSLALPAQPIYVSGDETRLSQVIMNLLTNGAKYTNPGGQVWVSLEQVEDQAIIRVRDNGIGLTNEQRTGIFEVFVQGATSLDRPQGGLGLGLAVVNQLLEAHGAQIQALSPGLGQGSEFVIRLPILFDLADTAPNQPQDQWPTSGRVLVVDDNVDFADTTARLLRSKGFEVYARYTGAQGLAGAESLQPDALLLDIGMPYLDGYEVCRQIRAQPWGQSMVIIALTGYGLETDQQKATQMGFDGHLLKPVDPSKMAQVVAGAIHRKQSP